MSTTQSAKQPRNDAFNTREPRYPCLFPGMLRVLFPEKSFIPISYAVRIANISCGGALVEIHEGNIEDEHSTFEGCLFELRIATGDVPPLYGKIARSDVEKDQGLFGLRFHQSYPELIGRLVHEEPSPNRQGQTPLPTPILNPFSPISDERKIVISGIAKKANEVVLMDEEGISHSVAADSEGYFSAKLNLKKLDFNEFRLISSNGERESSPLPVIVSYVPLPENDFHFHMESGTDINGNHLLSIDYMGAAEPAAQVVTELSKVMEGSKHARLSVTLTSREPMSPKQIQLLRADVEKIRKT
ncbi:MAG: PilZ domain-containing protein [Sumerlaeia bacterium]